MKSSPAKPSRSSQAASTSCWSTSKQPLQQGKSLEATLKVEDGGTVQVEFPIAAIGAPAPGAAPGRQMKMQGGCGGMMQMNKQ